METFDKHILPDRKAFEGDPFGYSSLAWYKWGLVQTISGLDVDLEKPPTSADLKNPVLWLSHAQALTQAAVNVLKNNPDFRIIPNHIQGICDSQYCAVGLMLIGYSLEVCLKAMLIMRNGVKGYASIEKKHKHHRLEELSQFVPNLSEKDKVILRILTHYITWAGRYPDPGSDHDSSTEEIFSLSEKYQIAAKDLFDLSARIMGYTKDITDKL